MAQPAANPTTSDSSGGAPAAQCATAVPGSRGHAPEKRALSGHLAVDAAAVTAARRRADEKPMSGEREVITPRDPN